MTGRPKKAVLDDIEFFLGAGMSAPELAARLGVHEESIYRACRLGGRLDLWRRMSGKTVRKKPRRRTA